MGVRENKRKRGNGKRGIVFTKRAHVPRQCLRQRSNENVYERSNKISKRVYRTKSSVLPLAGVQRVGKCSVRAAANPTLLKPRQVVADAGAGSSGGGIKAGAAVR